MEPVSLATISIILIEAIGFTISLIRRFSATQRNARKGQEQWLEDCSISEAPKDRTISSHLSDRSPMTLRPTFRSGSEEGIANLSVVEMS